MAAGRRRDVPPHHPDRSDESPSRVRRHLGGGRLSLRRRRQDMEADQPRPALAVQHPWPRGVLFMQKHWDVMRSDDAGDSWREVSGNLPTDFGFVIDLHAHGPEKIYVVPI